MGKKVLGRRKKTNEEFTEQVYNLVGEEYTFKETYIDSKTKIRVRHNTCEKVYEVTPNDFTSRGNRCPHCSRYRRRTIEEFKSLVYGLVEEEYTVIGKYVNSHTKIEIKHNVCGYVNKVRPNNFLGGTRCSICNESKGERTIREYLERNNIKYEEEKEFEDLIRYNPLRFDFYIEEYNLLIEYDGIQHYEHIPHFGTYDDYKDTIERDELKNNYCKENNIYLLRIPYNYINEIDNILDRGIRTLKKGNTINIDNLERVTLIN